MNFFLSCDWGSSNMRLRLVRTPDLNVEQEIKTEDGIVSLRSQHRQEVQKHPLQFYSSVLFQRLEELKTRSGRSLDSLPIIISGMASSTIGMKELPYQLCPLSFENTRSLVHPLGQVNGHSIFLITGLRTKNDVMRGEETQVIGAYSQLNSDVKKQIWLLPGTHSKHVVIERNKLATFHTYMTGELFQLLREKSILSHSVLVENSDGYAKPIAEEPLFLKGVKDAADGSNLLNKLFHIRSADIFGIRNGFENLSYLNGLLIGAELANVKDLKVSFYLIASGIQKELYESALKALQISSTIMDADTCMLQGQQTLLQSYLSTPTNFER